MKDAELVKAEKPDLSKLSYSAIRVALAYDTISPYAKRLIDFILKQEEAILEREEASKAYRADID